MISLRNYKQALRHVNHINIRSISLFVNLSQLKDDAQEVAQPTSLIDNVNEEDVPDPQMFNKSRLREAHRNLLHNQRPYSEPHSWIHLTEKYQRKMFGRHGAESGVDPRICFSTKEDVALQAEYESIAHPYTLSEMIETAQKAQTEKRERIAKREKDIEAKMAKLEQWKKELYAKVAKKEADALEAKERKERLVEEVRRHFGFNVDPKDERFKEMLELKEKEDKKKQKEAKRKEKEEKMMQKLIEKTN